MERQIKFQKKQQIRKEKENRHVSRLLSLRRERDRESSKVFVKLLNNCKESMNSLSGALRLSQPCFSKQRKPYIFTRETESKNIEWTKEEINDTKAIITLIEKRAKEEISHFEQMHNWKTESNKNKGFVSFKRRQLIKKRFHILFEKKNVLQSLKKKVRVLEEEQSIYETNLATCSRVPFPLENMPEEFICPITHDVMKNPVLDNEGISYEYEALVEWLRTKEVSPVTKRPLRKQEIRKNLNLKNLIANFSLHTSGKENFEQNN